MKVKEFKDYILKQMTAEEALEKLLSSHLLTYENLKLSDKEKCHPEIIIAMAAMDLGWQLAIEKPEGSEIVRGICVGTEEYLKSIFRNEKQAKNNDVQSNVSGTLFAFMKWYQENNNAVWSGMEHEIKRYLKANNLR